MNVAITDPAAKHVACVHCGASLPVSVQWQAETGPTGPTVADGVSAETAKPRRFPFISLLLVFPFGTLMLCTVIPLTTMRQLGSAFCGLLIGGGLILLALYRMRGRWSVGRALFASAVVVFWLGICVSMEFEKAGIRRKFEPLKAEFAHFKIPTSTQQRAIKPKLFPLFVQSRGQDNYTSDGPALPLTFDEFDIYKGLPRVMRAVTADEAQSVALIEWGWQSDAVGTCKIVVIDRKTRGVVASKTLSVPKPAESVPTPGMPAAHGTQPTAKDVIAYLSTLRLEAASAEAGADAADEFP